MTRRMSVAGVFRIHQHPNRLLGWILEVKGRFEKTSNFPMILYYSPRNWAIGDRHPGHLMTSPPCVWVCAACSLCNSTNKGNRQMWVARNDNFLRHYVAWLGDN